MPDIGQQQPARAATGYSSPQNYGQTEIGAAEAALDLFKQYARERPELVTMWAFGLGFVLGWKLRLF